MSVVYQRSSLAARTIGLLKSIFSSGGTQNLRFPKGQAILSEAVPPGVAFDHLRFPRAEAKGRFLFAGGQKLYVRGVTYGTFRPGPDGSEYPAQEVVERDFSRMVAAGLNTVRTYTAPPRRLLDAAFRHGLRVMAGIAWEQHIGFLEDRGRASAIEDRVRAGVRVCAGHPAVLCYAVGNEIPASAVRWYGPRRVERFIERLFRAAKEADPGGLVTYVNYPTTEYLDLPFLDLVCFNVYLESRERLEAYLARLHNLAGERPLILAEIGLDSRRHGEDAQAGALAWQIRSAFASGCAGAIVFAWTDEWHRGGHDIEDWDFGLTGRNRRPKPALAAVQRAFAEVPFSRDAPCPRISVIVCTYNGSRTLGECLRHARRLRYPDFEIIVVDDGSTDETASIAAAQDVKLIRIPNGGLSNARNVGLEAASGEIVAYIDDDAYPDPDWLAYLADAFRNSSHAGIGGPNIPPPEDGPVAQCVANAPGGPVHVLLSDREAEHIPGCNMAFRTDILRALGGFDPQFRAAGDDVDLCWRLQQAGWTLGFSPAAVVWHHRRNSVRAYWRQQRGYGRAEALLEKKWPEKYNHAGHVTWTGRVYGKGLALSAGCRKRIYHGLWGSAPFQRLYHGTPNSLTALLLTPEWYMVLFTLAALSGLGLLWRPMSAVMALLALASAGPLAQAVWGAARAGFATPPRSLPRRIGWRGLTAGLYLLQPLARLCGRISEGLTPWRRRGAKGFALPLPRTFTLWSERWQPPQARLRTVEAALRADRAYVLRGNEHERWDLEVRGGLLGAVRTCMMVEEHGAGRQLFRFRLRPRLSPIVFLAIPQLAFLLSQAAAGEAWSACAVLAAVLAPLVLQTFRESGRAMGALLSVLLAQEREERRAAPEADAKPSRPPAAIVPVFGPRGPHREYCEKVLVIGGAGYIGSGLVRSLLADGCRVRVLDSLLFGEESLRDLHRDPHFELIRGDVRDVRAVVRAVREMDAVIHLGGIVGDPACAVNEDETLDVNLAATSLLADVCRAFGVSRFLFASSCSVYGVADEPVSENSPLTPVSLYAATKLDSEKILLDARDPRFHPVLLRLATAFGWSRRPRFDLVVNLLTAKAAAEGKILIFNGEQWRPFVHVDDIARAFRLALTAPIHQVSGEIFNVGDNRLNLTLRQLAAFIRELEPGVTVDFVESPDRRNYCVNFNKIRDRLGFECRITLADGIRGIQQALRSGLVKDYRDPRYHNVQAAMRAARNNGAVDLISLQHCRNGHWRQALAAGASPRDLLEGRLTRMAGARGD